MALNAPPVVSITRSSHSRRRWTDGGANCGLGNTLRVASSNSMQRAALRPAPNFRSWLIPVFDRTNLSAKSDSGCQITYSPERGETQVSLSRMAVSARKP